MTETKTKKYIEGIGRRKEAVARVRLAPGGSKNEVLVNDKKANDYFLLERLQNTVYDALTKVKAGATFSISVNVRGGGMTAQAEAIRLGIARALEKHNPKLRTELKRLGFLKRDPRTVERKKFGLKKARKAAQWSKR